MRDCGCDWTAGILACNAAFFSGVKLRRSQIARASSCFALMQARMPAVQSHPPSPFLPSPFSPSPRLGVSKIPFRFSSEIFHKNLKKSLSRVVNDACVNKEQDELWVVAEGAVVHGIPFMTRSIQLNRRMRQ
jgi:hypothetical protein